MKEEKFIGKRELRRLAAVARGLSLVATLAWTSCNATERSALPVRPGALVMHPAGSDASTAPVASGRTTFVLLAIDGVRWEDVYRGVDPALARSQGLSRNEVLGAEALTPNLHALMQRGATLGDGERGTGIDASGPEFVSVPGYMEMLTGRRPTGCTTNGCDPTTYPTLADDFAALPGVSPLEVAVIASWEGVGRAAARDPSKLTVSVGRHLGETRDRLRYDARASELLDQGANAGPDPGIGDFRRDGETATIGLRYLEHVEPQFLFLGLGETDEYAHRNDYRGYLRALVQADRIVGEVATRLAWLEKKGRATTLVVTTDHGRSADFTGHGGGAPESRHVWVVAAGHGIRARGSVPASRERHLADITATLRLVAGVGRVDPSSEPLDELLMPERPALARF